MGIEPKWKTHNFTVNRIYRLSDYLGSRVNAEGHGSRNWVVIHSQISVTAPVFG